MVAEDVESMFATAGVRQAKKQDKLGDIHNPLGLTLRMTRLIIR